MTLQEITDLKIKQEISGAKVMLDEGWSKENLIEFIKANTVLRGKLLAQIIDAIEAY